MTYETKYQVGQTGVLDDGNNEQHVMITQVRVEHRLGSKVDIRYRGVHEDAKGDVYGIWFSEDSGWFTPTTP